MDPHGSEHHNTLPQPDSTSPTALPSPPPYSTPEPNNNPHLSPSSPPVIRTAQTYLTVLRFTPCQASSAGGAQSPFPPSDRSHQPLPASGQSLGWRRSTLSPSPSLAQSGLSPSTSNPYPALATPPSFQVSVIIPSPDLHLSPPPPPRWPEDVCPDLECSICFSQFNNVFRCPKMLQCRHTFCLECLARINVKSAEPDAIQCPLCRGLTPLPTLGLPKLATDPAVLAYLPDTMQKVYSVRFQRNKGKLQVKRSGEQTCLPSCSHLNQLISTYCSFQESLIMFTCISLLWFFLFTQKLYKTLFEVCVCLALKFKLS